MPEKKEKKKPIVKRAPRTPKEKAFAKEYIANGGNGTQAAVRVYDTDLNGARAIASQKLAKLSIVEMMDMVEGLTLADRLKCLAEGLYADKRDQFSGETTPDYNARHRYLDLSFKLDGSLQAGTTINATQNNITVTPILSGLSQGEELSTPNDTTRE